MPRKEPATPSVSSTWVKGALPAAPRFVLGMGLDNRPSWEESAPKGTFDDYGQPAQVDPAWSTASGDPPFLPRPPSRERDGEKEGEKEGRRLLC